MYALWMLLQDEHEVIELEDDNLPPRETVTGVCGGLIVIDAMSNSVRLVHYTAQDYLRRTHQDSLSQRQLELTEISVHYLGLAEFSDGPAMSDADMADRLTRFPFLNYAANYWGVEIDEVQSENFWKPLNRFLSNQVAVSVANQVWSLPHYRYVRWSQDYPANVPVLVLASSFKLLDVLHKLVEQGHSIEGCGSDGETPLIRAARLGHAGNVAKLIRFGANVALTDVAGETAIERAASIGNSAAVKALLEGGAEANTTDHTVGWTVLMSAVASGNFETGESALSLATLSGQEPIASLLADVGAVLKLNKAGRRASIQVNRKGLQALVKRLTTFRDPDYTSVADTGLQREGNAVRNQLALIAKLEEEASASHRQQANQESQVGTIDDLVDLGVDLEEIGKGYFAKGGKVNAAVVTVQRKQHICDMPDFVVSKAVAVRHDEGQALEIIPQHFELRVQLSQQKLVLFCLVASFPLDDASTSKPIYLRFAADSLHPLHRTVYNKVNPNPQDPSCLHHVWKLLQDTKNVTCLQFQLRSGKHIQLAVPLEFNPEKIPNNTTRSIFQSAELLAAASSFSLYFRADALRKRSLREYNAAILRPLTEEVSKLYKDMLDVKRLYNGIGGKVHRVHISHGHHDGSSGTRESCSSPASAATAASCGSTLPFETVPRPPESPPPYDEYLNEGQSPRVGSDATSTAISTKSLANNLTPPEYSNTKQQHDVCQYMHDRDHYNKLFSTKKGIAI
ncbi:putative ankyrin [Colletotrichum sublineola]|uniref:Putative ankyrin n=1 Tax=Colletotrichum sublineola TaxID=1173701 RepID=A0A066XZ25_COLSU|nr:putative ankyrin [Colletotrichum sublineola]